MVTPQRDRGHPLGMAPSSIPPHHLLVAPGSAPSASKGVRWPMSGTVLPVPGLSPALATRCRDSPDLLAAVSRDEEDAWKRSRTDTQRRRLSRSEQHQHGLGGTEGEVWGAQTQDAFVFLPAGARGRRRSRTPARATGLQLDPADGSRHSQTRKAAGSGGVRT